MDRQVPLMDGLTLRSKMQHLTVFYFDVHTGPRIGSDIRRKMDRQVPLMDRLTLRFENTSLDNAASDLKNTNVRLKDTVNQLRSSQNFCIDIILLCIIFGIAAYPYKPKGLTAMGSSMESDSE
ncbi:Syntaxin-71 [Camellia lanceoleosa]|uniref:Syntaxin-71 n=1 Tax=Camellia lanceoleosa TaxID=1840588 RepID=A0ACC0FI63_9ERIC|nr:Syntaxin-71 [Camellia lanceoleosa]